VVSWRSLDTAGRIRRNRELRSLDRELEILLSLVIPEGFAALRLGVTGCRGALASRRKRFGAWGAFERSSGRNLRVQRRLSSEEVSMVENSQGTSRKHYWTVNGQASFRRFWRTSAVPIDAPAARCVPYPPSLHRCFVLHVDFCVLRTHFDAGQESRKRVRARSVVAAQ
jgi:hypothetical protein